MSADHTNDHAEHKDHDADDDLESEHRKVETRDPVREARRDTFALRRAIDEDTISS